MAKAEEKRSDSNLRPALQEVQPTLMDFLRSEYDVANEWAMHGENLSHRILSFYVTSVTATLGGALAISQSLSESMQSSMLILGVACLILLFAGPVFYQALLRDHIRNIDYHNRMAGIRAVLLKDPDEESWTLEAGIDFTNADRSAEPMDPYHPSAVQYTLVGLVNSLIMGVSIPSLLWGIAGPGFKLTATLLTSIGASFDR